MDFKRKDQLPNGKTCALSLLTGWKQDWLDQSHKTEDEHLKNIEKVDSSYSVVMPIYNKTKLDCMYETNKLKCRSTLKKKKIHKNITGCHPNYSLYYIGVV